MINRIPSQNRFLQTGKGDTSGNVWSSRNLDFEVNEGKVRPSESMIGVTNSTDTNSPQSTPFMFAKHRGTVSGLAALRYWTLGLDTSGDTRAFQTIGVWGDFDLDTVSPAFDSNPEECDMIEFNSDLYVVGGRDIDKRSSSSWSSVYTTLSTGRKLLSIYAGRLYIVNGEQTVASMNTSDVVVESGSNTLDIGTAGSDNQTISAMRAVSGGLWIGTVNERGGRAKMYFWDGETENTVEASYKLPTAGVMAITIKEDRPYVMGMNGVLYTFNGSYFQEVARIDVEERLLHQFSTDDSDKFIHPNGMVTVRDEILININTRPYDSNDTTPRKSPSGIYAYHPDYGMYHKFSLSSQDDSTTQYDYGQVELAEAGALWVLYEDDDTDDVDEYSDVMAGYSYMEDNSTQKYAVGVHQKRGLQQDLIKCGVFVTPEFYSEEARQSWMKVFLRIRPMDNDTDKIVLKYRTRKYTAFEADITWVDTTSFTSTDANFANAAVGYEFEGLQGDGAGFLAHITAISESGGTYTVTLDETITNATTRTAKCRIDNWVKSIDVTKDDQPEDIPALTVGTVSSKIQYKLYMVGDIELEEFISVSKPDAFIA
jgi:hypothetical protein